MAAVSHVAVLNTTTNASSYATANFTPAANLLFLVLVHSCGAVPSGDTLTSNGGGLTFTKIGEATATTNSRRAQAWIASGNSSAVSQSLTYAAGVSLTGCYIEVVGVSGLFRVGTDAIRQYDTADNVITNTAQTYVFPASALTANPIVIGSTSDGGTGSPSPNPTTGWTADAAANVSYGTPTTRNVMWRRDSGWSSDTITFSSYNAPQCGIAVEFDTSATGNVTNSNGEPATFEQTGFAAEGAVALNPSSFANYFDTSITGNATTPANALGAPDGVWTEDAVDASWSHRWGLAPTTNEPVGTIDVRVKARKVGGSGTPSITQLNLYQDDVFIANLLPSAVSITSTEEENVDTSFDASSIVGSSNVSLEIVVAASGGGPSARASVQIDSARWSGTVNLTNNINSNGAPGTFALSGVAASAVVAKASNGAAGTYSLTGVAAFGGATRNSIGSPGTYAFSGNASSYTLARASVGAAGSYAQIGEVASSAAARIATGESGTYAQTGFAAEGKISVGVEEIVSVADPAGYVWQGVAAQSNRERVSVGNPEEFSFTGLSAFGVVARVFVSAGDPGTYAQTGASSFGTSQRASIASATTYAMAGEAAVSSVQYRSIGGFGAYGKTGFAATSATQRNAQGDAGLYTLAGAQARSTVDDIEGESPGAFTLNGVAATASVERASSALEGTFAFNGAGAFGYREFDSVAETGVFGATGFAAESGTSSDHVAIADAGNFALSGVNGFGSRALSGAADAGSFALQVEAFYTEYQTRGDAGLFAYSGFLTYADRGSVAAAIPYGWIGYEAITATAYLETALPGIFEWVGVDTLSLVERFVLSNAQPGAYTLAGEDAFARQVLSSPADPGLFYLLGNPATARADNQGGPAGLLTRTIVKKIRVPTPAPPAPALTAEQRLSLERAAAAATRPAIVISAPAPVGPPPITPVAGPVSVPPAGISVPSPVREAIPKPAVVAPIFDVAEVAAALAEVDRLMRELEEASREIKERETQIADLEDAVGAAFAAGMMVGDDG